jgi:hypothetical protein
LELPCQLQGLRSIVECRLRTNPSPGDSETHAMQRRLSRETVLRFRLKRTRRGICECLLSFVSSFDFVTTIGGLNDTLSLNSPELHIKQHRQATRRSLSISSFRRRIRCAAIQLSPCVAGRGWPWLLANRGGVSARGHSKTVSDILLSLRDTGWRATGATHSGFSWTGLWLFHGRLTVTRGLEIRQNSAGQV